jgi:general secretion pathway protein D/MSHA biogenesis protein MshL
MSTKITVNKQNPRWTKKIGSAALRSSLVLFMTGLILGGCVSGPTPNPEKGAQKFIDEQTTGTVDGLPKTAKQDLPSQQNILPVRYQKLSYDLGGSNYHEALESDPIPVGADYTPKGPMTLKSILSLLTNLKQFSISWSSDVNQNVLVDVPTIRATEDFFKVIDNILRQNDYSYVVQGRTLIVKHKETKKFHIAMPFMSSTFSTSVGGDVLGSTEGSNMSGTLNIASQNNTFDIWGNIQANLDKILEIWAAPAATAPVTNNANPAAGSPGTVSPAPVAVVASPPGGRGYYTIDKPIGLITVTAPRSIIEKIESYIENLKAELYKQVSIEAKIVEVTFTDDNTTGINWSDLLTRMFDFGLDLSKTSWFMPTGAQNNSVFTIGTESFGVIIDAMKEEGHVEVLSNPKITVMNGQPAMISVGENVTYVDNVSSTTDVNGVISFSINTASVMSGLGLGVIASITENDEVILTLTPVTSDLTQPIQYVTFGTNQVGLPKVNLRELNTIVRVRSGEMLIIGGLIDNTATYDNDYVSGLGKTPVAGQLFRADGTVTEKKELIILMRPQILAL